MVAHDAQHVGGVAVIVREGAELAGHLGRGRIGDAGHDRGQAGADGAAFGAVVGDAGGHQQAADIGVAEAERAVLVGEPRDLLRRELRHHDGDLEHHGPQPDRVLIGRDVDRAVGVAVGQKVDRGEVAGRVVEEHVFRARVRRADRAAGRRGVPVVHRRVEVQARIGRRPGGVADLFPEVAGLQRLVNLAVQAADKIPVFVLLDGAQEIVLERDRVVGVLAGHGEVGLRIPIGIVGLEGHRRVALLGELDDAVDVILRHRVLLGRLDLALQRRVDGRVEAVVVMAFAIDAGLHDGFEVLLDDLRAGHQRGDLLLFLHLPVDVVLDVGVVDVDHHHLGGAARRAARLDGARRAVADLQEAHQAGGAAAARQLFAFAAQQREIGAGARAVFEQARFAHPQIHDAALVDEVVGHALDEAGMRLRMLVGGFRLGQLAGERVDVVMALAGTVDAIGPVQAGVEPLRRIGRHALGGEHVGKLVAEGERIVFAGEIAALPAPIGPGAGQPVEHLPCVGLGDVAFGGGQLGKLGLVGNRAPQEGGDVVLLDLPQLDRHAGLAEIFLRQDVGRHLGELRRHVDVVEPEHHRAVRVADLRKRLAEVDLRIGRLTGLGETAFDAHGLFQSLYIAPVHGNPSSDSACGASPDLPAVSDVRRSARRWPSTRGPIPRWKTGCPRSFGRPPAPCPTFECDSLA